MFKTAIFWIRDGVLIDRMAVNAVAFAFAFAFACLRNHDATKETPSLTSLVNFAFDTSGISCAEKINLFNARGRAVVTDVDATVDFYNKMASRAALHCVYFSGAKQLLEKTHALGCLNFITSAVDQAVIDGWGASEQAKVILPYLKEILGWRSPSICKGRGHFNYVREKYGVEQIIYVADAISEIADGRENSCEFAVVPIGFANLITPQAVAQAFDQVLAAFLALANLPAADLKGFSLELANLTLPDRSALEMSLKNAGADYLASNSADRIMDDLEKLLMAKILSRPKSI